MNYPKGIKKEGIYLPALPFKLINGYQLTMLSKHETARHSIIKTIMPRNFDALLMPCK